MPKYEPVPFEHKPDNDKFETLRRDIATLFDLVNALEAKNDEIIGNVKRIASKLTEVLESLGEVRKKVKLD